MDDDQMDIIAKMGGGLVTETAGRMWTWLPNALRRRQLDPVFRGPLEPYLMTGHMWLKGTNVPVDGRWFRVGVLNKSSTAITGVSVQLISGTRPVSCTRSR